MTKKRAEVCSLLSFALSQNPDAIGIKPGLGGWVSIRDLLRCVGRVGLTLSQPMVLDAASAYKKPRFWISADGTKVRIDPAYAAKLERGLVALEPPKALYTFSENQTSASLLGYGVIHPESHYVKLWPDLDDVNKASRRIAAPVILEVNAEEMSEAGYAFYLSDTGIWITESVPQEYIEIVTGAQL